MPIRNMEAISVTKEESPEGSVHEDFDLSTAARRERDEVDLFNGKRTRRPESHDPMLGKKQQESLM